MFVTVLFGDGRMEMLNLNCKLVNFIHHLKEKCGLDFKERVELMDSGGRVMNLEPLQHSGAPAGSVLAARRLYVLLRVCQGNEESGDCKYVSLLNNTESHPEFTELLRKLSNPNQETERNVRRLRTQRSKNISTDRNKKS
ncbi:uncharacterized protein C22orf15 homolog [Xiphophorus maculatus]|uniref:uncharacterized protein C22orf15 homolog n=1 Tax=Xiphophorus maculatus TaxID=8083 RepID=UPI000C6DBDBD|nr:uncharacterized protein C22orf15 homolog [Xiphophorus maculatus]XP_032433550.1 uncharacterized protein C22orf15 homolog [Xiphophorus hellerii]